MANEISYVTDTFFSLTLMSLSSLLNFKDLTCPFFLAQSFSITLPYPQVGINPVLRYVPITFCSNTYHTYKASWLLCKKSLSSLYVMILNCETV